MVIKQFVMGLYENNSYVLRKNETAKSCLIIDTALDIRELIEYLQQEELEPEVLLCSHGHGDHIAGIAELRQNWPRIKVAIHKDDQKMITDAELNLSGAVGAKIVSGPAEIIIEKAGLMSLAGFDFEVIETPGHTPGGICCYFKEEKALFSGDTLFAESIGRTDFKGYDQQKCFKQLVSNIKEKLFVLPEDTKVYPGHGPATTIGHEKRYNPYAG